MPNDESLTRQDRRRTGGCSTRANGRTPNQLYPHLLHEIEGALGNFRVRIGWPASIGNRSKARTHLKRSVELGPEYPANHLELLTACLDWKDRRTAEKLLPGVEQCLRNARRAFSGEQWDWSWNDWEQMWRVQQDRFRKLSK